MLRSALIAYETLKISAVTLVDSLRGRLDRATVDEHLRHWAGQVARRAGLELEVVGAAAIDWSRSYVVMSNHQSLMDIPALSLAIPASLRFVAKTELFRIPLWGPAMRAAGIVEIDRARREQAISTLRQASSALGEGVNIWIAPEGTRSSSGELGKLKKGGFMMAVESGTPILPVVIRGTRDSLPARAGLGVGVRPARATVTFGAPIEVVGRTREELMAEVEAFLRRGLAS